MRQFGSRRGVRIAIPSRSSRRHAAPGDASRLRSAQMGARAGFAIFDKAAIGSLLSTLDPAQAARSYERAIERPALGNSGAFGAPRRLGAGAGRIHCPPVVLSLARRRHDLHRRVHRPARCEHRAADLADARARLSGAAERSQLGGHRLPAGICLDPAGVRAPRRDRRPQGDVFNWICAVHCRLRLVRAGLGSDRVDCVPCPPGHRRGDARRQQHRHSGQGGGSRPAGPRHGHFRRGPGGRDQRGTGCRRRAAGGARLALGVLGQSPVRAGRGDDRLAGHPANHRSRAPIGDSTGRAQSC